MDWANIVEQIFTVVIIPLLGALTLWLISYIHAKRDKLKQELSNETLDKYIDMLDNTITNCVLATTQTYVEALKKKGKFDLEAQKTALQQTYDNVMKILTEDAKVYLETAVGDLNQYILNKIEAEVNISKNI